ncbi:uncharacterized protein BT62DRAFT_1001045 [Guyanagaster necrorhizus]|uniref:NAD(P)-binding domain-containing protein n=1 Tax=Guyanagaster necrorhizus TaxID=856835 RepID=A0A9P7W2K5_9AGAR|nr:uncharacterized protein BT62DRAFT_1001045 [Guyanagaster necrorhizus MCA 3950]KAG7450191.1 hypothetical protein BT62DRAFT_1001045 [Guyanagaster necrorhizus MCA 3950]
MRLLILPLRHSSHSSGAPAISLRRGLRSQPIEPASRLAMEGSDAFLSAPGYARAQNKAASISDPNKKFSMNLFFLIVCLVKIIARTAYEDIVAFGNLVRAQDELDWTIVRVPNLRDGEKMDAFAGSIGQAGVFHDRMAFASFTVKELLEPQWMKKNVAISSEGGHRFDAKLFRRNILNFFVNFSISLDMRILIFGPTGPSGILLVRETLDAFQSCTLILYARNPSKLPTDITSNKSVITIQGELDEYDKLSKAMEGVDAVLSTLGHNATLGENPFQHSDTPIAKVYERIIDLMHFHSVKRLIALGTPSMSDPRDKFSLAWSIMIGSVATLAHTSYRDVVETGKIIRLRGADLDWTIVRVPRMTNKDQKEVVAGYIGDRKTGFSLSRAGFAAFVVKELCASRPQWVKAAPLLSSP